MSNGPLLPGGGPEIFLYFCALQSKSITSLCCHLVQCCHKEFICKIIYSIVCNFLQQNSKSKSSAKTSAANTANSAVVSSSLTIKSTSGTLALDISLNTIRTILISVSGLLSDVLLD